MGDCHTPGLAQNSGMDVPEVRYAKSGDVHIAYCIRGNGPVDLVHIPGWISNIELMWEDPRMRTWLDRMATFSRLIVFDKRGTGLSDRVADDRLPDLESRMDDVRAVMDAAGSQRAFLLGHSEGGLLAALFATTYPARTAGVVFFSSDVRGAWAPDHPWGMTRDEFEKDLEAVERGWGNGTYARSFAAALAPSLARDEDFCRAPMPTSPPGCHSSTASTSRKTLQEPEWPAPSWMRRSIMPVPPATGSSPPGSGERTGGLVASMRSTACDQTRASDQGPHDVLPIEIHEIRYRMSLHPLTGSR